MGYILSPRTYLLNNDGRGECMKIFSRRIQIMLAYVFALLLVVNFPLMAMAEGTVDNPQASTMTPDTNTVPLPSASQQKPNYTYNATTGRWDSDQWYYDSTSGTYKATPTIQPVANSSVTDPTIITPQSDAGLVSGQQDLTATSNSLNQTDLSNSLLSQAKSGDATVILNTLAASAASGDASAMATIVNNINSSLSTGGNQKAASFVTDVIGDVTGDIVLQPMLLKAMLEAGSNNSSSTVATVNNNASIANDINLNATTGNAGVVANTKAGDATSGSANTVANVINIINSMVAANQSFYGTVNIYGNLNGDILIAPDFIPQLIASNGTLDGNNKDSKSVTIVDANDTQSIINNVSLAAESGKAAVMDNTKAGNAITGDANTNVVIFNLSGHEIVASNSLLVFVNVLGKWVGVIVDAPVGTTAAAIGNNVTDNKTSPDLVVVSNNNGQITNNIALVSKSGNATVAANTNAGNATSGNSTASANIANLTNSQFGLSGWFGVLFINVFGNWYGSFGIDTAYGNPTINNSVYQTNDNSNLKVIDFIPKTSNHRTYPILTVIDRGNDNSYFASVSDQKSETAKILGSTVSSNGGQGPLTTNSTSPKIINTPLIFGSMLIFGVSAVGVKRFMFNGKNKSAY